MTRSILRRIATACAAALALLAGGLVVGHVHPASAANWVGQYQAGTVQAPDGMIIGDDVLSSGRFLPRIRAGELLVGASPSSDHSQRVEATASLQRFDDAAQAWRSTGQSATVLAWIIDTWHKTPVGSGSAASAWTFTELGAAPALYRISFSITWFETDSDSDTTNDKVLGQALLRPSETGESVCRTTAFSNWPSVTYDVPCSVTDQGIVI
jgi:hypothetical protein